MISFFLMISFFVEKWRFHSSAITSDRITIFTAFNEEDNGFFSMNFFTIMAKLGFEGLDLVWGRQIGRLGGLFFFFFLRKGGLYQRVLLSLKDIVGLVKKKQKKRT